MKQGVTFTVARLESRARRRLRESGIIAQIGAEHVYPTVHAAVEAYAEQRDDVEADAVPLPKE